MKQFFLIFLVVWASCRMESTSTKVNTEKERWEQFAANTEIIRDDFGVPHIYGKTDADAVFGLLYAQCEDDFYRVERNYIWAIGRLAEVEGKKSLYSDLRARLYMTKEEAIEKYEASPEWLKKLCIAFADGANYYLHTHPEVKPKLITHFEPWMPFYFSEGSIGGDIERVSTKKIKAFYDGDAAAQLTLNEIDKGLLRLNIQDPQGSNGIALAGSMTQSGNTMLLINPHTSFFFRGEVHVVSEEGLNAYGAVTWGQFFVYQGFNEKTGWMHTSTGTDIIDEFEEVVEKKDGKLMYKYGAEYRPVESKEVTLKYKDEVGQLQEKTFTMYRTHHGPITHKNDDKWVATALMWKPTKALEQSFTRTKKANHQEFKEMMNIRTNSSNNTVFADAEGNIAYYHGNFIPRRNEKFDYSKPVDGSNPETDWNGLHSVDENILVVNPPNGWIQNCNSTPFTSAATYSPKREDYPAYMATYPENFRGVHAIDLLSKTEKLSLDGLIKLAYNPFVPFAAELAPDIVKAYDKYPRPALKSVVDVLRTWDYKTSEESIGMTLIKFYMYSYDKLHGKLPRTRDFIAFTNRLNEEIPEKQQMDILEDAVKTLEADFGTWKTPWGEFNRYQRINGDRVQAFNDELESTPIGMASGGWGALASYGARKSEGTKKQYGLYGNSFVAVVEFGDKVKAKTMLAGGQSGDPNSPHFDDQVIPYANCNFKTAAYYKEDVLKRAKKTYHPGERK